MNYGYGNGAEAGALVALIFGIYAIALVAILLVNYLLYAIALMLFFRKVGVEEWIAWIPFYRYWKWLEVGGQHGAFSLFGIIPYGAYVTYVFLFIGMWRTGRAFGKDAGMLVLGIFLPFVWLFILASRDEVYHPEWLASYGYPPPLAGFGSVPHGTPPPPPPPAAS
jgi:uncharacterized membrane protein (GlpM family)